jgi:hypothetical protein
MEYFQSRKNVYWPKKYEGVVNTIRSQTEANAPTSDFKPFYKTNAHVLILAAAIGLIKGLKEPLDKEKNEIDRAIFESNFFVSQKLVFYMALIVFFYQKDEKAEIIREENDDELIRTFEELAAGGLRYLEESQFNSENHDPTAIPVLQEILMGAFRSARRA